MTKLSIPDTREGAREVMEYLLSGKAEFHETVNYLKSRPVESARPQELLGYRDVLWERRKKANNTTKIAYFKYIMIYRIYVYKY